MNKSKSRLVHGIPALFAKEEEEEEEEGIPNDIGALAADSFSDGHSDDSNSWMKNIDVNQFKQLTSPKVENGCSDLEHSGGRRPATDHTGYSSRSLLVQPPTALVVQQQSSRCSSSSASFPSPADSLNSPAQQQQQQQSQHMTISSNNNSESISLFSRSGGSMKEERLNSSEYENTTTANPRLVQSIAYPKPTYSYSCLIALSLKNSKTGQLTVAEIYSFMCENFPYFLTAPNGWKNSVRHNLSLNKCFQKIEIDAPGGHGRKSCLWMLNPQKVAKMEQEIRKWRERDPAAIKEAMRNPDDLEKIENGEKGMPGEYEPFIFGNISADLQSGQNSQHLLLVKTSQLQNMSRYSRHASSESKWGSLAKVARLRVPGPSKTPPLTGHRSKSLTLPPDTVVGDSVSIAAARNLQAVLQQRSPTAFSTPIRNSRNVLQQSSPFSHTPPYSPTAVSSSPSHISSGKTSTDCWSSSCSLLRSDHLYQQQQQQQQQLQHSQSPYQLGSPHLFGFGQFSPYSQQRTANSYETAASAISNNSLLQSALAQSPCRGPALTFQAL